ncbi:MAG: type II toxin-antitoxin system mRNA interferase toxin, RelE/StbE family [bacterium]|nr:type II toxin-antitoxin system mRNA interferase toxin, RelE/StbE family [bacterium]MDT8366535.1 type II toxin-antitoxin system mRNA interferase toxin, RelE/StbE family [bacterium]
MTWRVLITPAALEMLKGITDRRIRGQIAQTVSGLTEAPENSGKPLMGELAGYRSLRAASQKYRVIYKIKKEKVIVVVVAVGRRKEGDRRDIYSLARKLFEQKLV